MCVTARATSPHPPPITHPTSMSGRDDDDDDEAAAVATASAATTAAALKVDPESITFPKNAAHASKLVVITTQLLKLFLSWENPSELHPLKTQGRTKGYGPVKMYTDPIRDLIRDRDLPEDTEKEPFRVAVDLLSNPPTYSYPKIDPPAFERPSVASACVYVAATVGVDFKKDLKTRSVTNVHTVLNWRIMLLLLLVRCVDKFKGTEATVVSKLLCVHMVELVDAMEKCTCFDPDGGRDKVEAPLAVLRSTIACVRAMASAWAEKMRLLQEVAKLKAAKTLAPSSSSAVSELAAAQSELSRLKRTRETNDTSTSARDEAVVAAAAAAAEQQPPASAEAVSSSSFTRVGQGLPDLPELDWFDEFPGVDGEAVVLPTDDSSLPLQVEAVGLLTAASDGQWQVEAVAPGGEQGQTDDAPESSEIDYEVWASGIGAGDPFVPPPPPLP